MGLYEGINPEKYHVMEHDCYDCDYSWDLKHGQTDNVCPKCGSDNLQIRAGKNGLFHQTEHNIISYEDRSIQSHPHYSDSLLASGNIMSDSFKGFVIE